MIRMRKTSFNYEITKEREAKLRNVSFSLLLRKIVEERVLPLLDTIPFEELLKNDKRENAERIYQMLFKETDFKRETQEPLATPKPKESKEEKKKGRSIEDLIE